MAKQDVVADEPPWADEVTQYDEVHMVHYLRLLDAEAEGADWHEVARIILQREPDTDAAGAKRCWESHLRRARWVAALRFRQLGGDGAA